MVYRGHGPLGNKAEEGGGVVPVSCWAAILSVLPQRESQLCICSEDALGVALTTVVFSW